MVKVDHNQFFSLSVNHGKVFTFLSNIIMINFFEESMLLIKQYLWLLIVTLVLPLQSFLVLSAEYGAVEDEVDSLLLVGVGTIELVEDDDED